MAIKNLRFSFDVPITELLALIATRNDSLHIDVIGDGKEPKQPKQLRNGAAAIAGFLEDKRGKHSKIRGKDEAGHQISGREVIAKAILAAPDHTADTKTLGGALEAHGLNAKSVSPQISIMRKDGDVRRITEGTYRVTPQGARNFLKMLKVRDEKIGAQQ
jgi:hypothetical protein